MALTPMRLRRLEREWTLFDVHRKTEIAASKLSMIERGLVAPRDDERRRIAKALDADPAALFPASVADGEQLQTVDADTR